MLRELLNSNIELIVYALLGLFAISVIRSIVNSIAIGHFLMNNNLPLMKGYGGLTYMLQANELEKAFIFNKIDDNQRDEAKRLLRIYNWTLFFIAISIGGFVLLWGYID